MHLRRHGGAAKLHCALQCSALLPHFWPLTLSLHDMAVSPACQIANVDVVCSLLLT